MTIYDIVSLMVDPGFFKLDVYDFTTEKVIFSGFAEDLPDEIECLEILSIDNPVKDILCLNVETGDNNE